MSGLIQTPFLNTAHDDTTTISLDPCMPTQLSTPFEHLATPVHGGNHSMYTPPDPHTFPHNGYSLAYDHPQYPNQPVAGPSFAPPPFHLQHDPSPIGDYQYGFPDNGDWQGNTDWDEDEYRDGDVIYGNLEVSDQNPNQNQNQNQNQNPGTAFQSPSSLPPPHVPDKSAPKQVKHRRRTTPEQLKVLEHWFDINSKPDNNLREWLASELGMTKRNIQVWFQNRRAKVKGQAQKQKEAAEKVEEDAQALEGSRTPERQPVTLPVLPPIRIKTSPEKQSILLPPVNNVNMGRRVSLANGEAAKIEMWVAKRVAAGQGIGVGGGTGRPPGHISPFRSPIAGQAAAARRSSIPYPTPIPENQTQQQPLRSPNGLSPKISPSVRPMPSTLHLTALRNNSRRASMPGAAQLISSGPFTPPRVISGNYPIGSGNGRTRRELSPIKDHDGDHAEARHQLNFVFGDTDFSTTYLTPPSSTYLPSNTSPTSYLPPDSGSMVYDYSLDPSQHAPFTPNGPLPNPTFSFGSGSTDGPSNSGTDDHSVWMSMQPRVRMGSLASINTFTTDGGVPDSGSDFGQDWMTPPGTEGFDPDARRASAYVKSSNKAAPRRKKRQADKRNRPADLLHHLGILGIDTNLPLTATNGAHPLRPSPLGNGNGNGFTMDSFGQPVYQFQPSFQSDHFQSDSTTINYSISADGYRTHSNPPSDHSPLSSESAPSPTHVNIPTFTSPGYSLTSLSSFSNHSQSTQPQPFIMQPVNQHRYGEMVGQQRVGVVEGKDDFGFFPELGGEPVNVLV